MQFVSLYGLIKNIFITNSLKCATIDEVEFSSLNDKNIYEVLSKMHWAERRYLSPELIQNPQFIGQSSLEHRYFVHNITKSPLTHDTAIQISVIPKIADNGAFLMLYCLNI